MLPGDYIALLMTGRTLTTPSGLSEGILWDFRKHDRAEFLLRHYDISPDVLPEPVPTFSVQGELTAQAASELGMKAGTPVAYRAGDQPNNAFSLNVLNPGEIAATAGTSGVVYGVADTPVYDRHSRVNTFVHVNYTKATPRYGVLLCVSGTGILNSWLRRTMAAGDEGDYQEMNVQAGSVPIGAEGLVMLPYGNGAERTLGDRDPGCALRGLRFNVHNRAHVLRAAQEGIVFALNYGFSIMNGIGVNARTVRAGHANMFLSPLFREAFATLTGARVELYNTEGSAGAARGAGVGCGLYTDTAEAFQGLATVETIEPAKDRTSAYAEAYERWRTALNDMMAASE
jgi:xylulokinase